MPNEEISRDFEKKDWIAFYNILIQEANKHYGQALYTQAITNAVTLTHNLLDGTGCGQEIKWFSSRNSTLLSVLSSQITPEQKIKFEAILHDIKKGGDLLKQKILGSDVLQELNKCDSKRTAPEDGIRNELKRNAKEAEELQKQFDENDPAQKKPRIKSFIRTGGNNTTLFVLPKKDPQEALKREKDNERIQEFSQSINEITLIASNNIENFDLLFEKITNIFSRLDQISFFFKNSMESCSQSLIITIKSVCEKLAAKAKEISATNPIQAIEYFAAEVKLIEKTQAQVLEEIRHPFLDLYLTQCYAQLTTLYYQNKLYKKCHDIMDSYRTLVERNCDKDVAFKEEFKCLASTLIKIGKACFGDLFLLEKDFEFYAADEAHMTNYKDDDFKVEFEFLSTTITMYEKALEICLMAKFENLELDKEHTITMQNIIVGIVKKMHLKANIEMIEKPEQAIITLKNAGAYIIRFPAYFPIPNALAFYIFDKLYDLHVRFHDDADEAEEEKLIITPSLLAKELHELINTSYYYLQIKKFTLEKPPIQENILQSQKIGFIKHWKTFISSNPTFGDLRKAIKIAKQTLRQFNNDSEFEFLQSWVDLNAKVSILTSGKFPKRTRSNGSGQIPDASKSEDINKRPRPNN